MTKEELLKSIIPHVQKWNDDWGVGQRKISEIVRMVEVGKKFDLTFRFAKKVTALDDMNWNLKTVIANEDSLFVFPSKIMDLTDFWEEVNS